MSEQVFDYELNQVVVNDYGPRISGLSPEHPKSRSSKCRIYTTNVIKYEHGIATTRSGTKYLIKSFASGWSQDLLFDLLKKAGAK